MNKPSFIYVDDVINRIDDITDTVAVKDMFNKLYEITEDDRYKVKHVTINSIAPQPQNALFLIMESGVTVPLAKSMIPQERYLDNLNLFVSYEQDDPRKIYIEAEETRELIYTILKNEMVKIFNKPGNAEHRNKYFEELMFIKENPLKLTLGVRRDKLTRIIDEFIKRLTIDDANASSSKGSTTTTVDKETCSDLKKTSCNGICKWDNKQEHCSIRVPSNMLRIFRERLTEAFLTQNVKMDKVIIDGGFSHEITFDQRDVRDQKVKRIKDALANPYTFVDAVIDKYVNTVLEDKIKVKRPVRLKNVINEDWDTLPTDFNKAFNSVPQAHTSSKKNLKDDDPRYFSRNVPSEDVEANAKFIYDLFRVVGKLVNSQLKTSEATFRLIVKNSLISHKKKREITKESLQAFVQTLRDMNAFVESKASKTNFGVDNVVQMLENDQDYIMSEFELAVVSELLNVNIILLARKNKERNPNGIKCFKPNKVSPYYVIVFQKTVKMESKKYKYDQYSLVARNKLNPQILFKRGDVPHIDQYIAKSCKDIFIIIKNQDTILPDMPQNAS